MVVIRGYVSLGKVDAYAGKVNDSLAAVQDGLAIVAVGDTHAAITSGQFVYVKEHNTLPEGLYTASTNIAANGALSTSNLTADSKGGLNALSDQIGNVGTRNYVATVGLNANGLKIIAFNLNKESHSSVTVNSIMQMASSTERKSEFTLGSVASDGFVLLYSNSTSLSAGACVNVNLTIT